MTDEAREPVREQPFEPPGDGAGPPALECPECGDTFEGATAKMRLGLHRKREHGVTGANAHKKGRGEPAGDRPRRQAPAARPPRQKGFDYEGTMLAWYRMAGDLWAVKDPTCGTVMRDHVAPSAAKAWAELAKQHEGVRRFIESGTQAGGWMGLALAHAPLAMAITAHHVQPALERRRAAEPADAGEFIQEPDGAFAGDPAAA